MESSTRPAAEITLSIMTFIPRFPAWPPSPPWWASDLRFSSRWRATPGPTRAGRRACWWSRKCGGGLDNIHPLLRLIYQRAGTNAPGSRYSFLVPYLLLRIFLLFGFGLLLFTAVTDAQRLPLGFVFQTVLGAVAVMDDVVALVLDEHLLAIQQGGEAFLARLGAFGALVFGCHGRRVIGR